MKTSDCLRLVRSAAQVIDAGWLPAPQRKHSGFKSRPFQAERKGLSDEQRKRENQSG